MGVLDITVTVGFTVISAVSTGHGLSLHFLVVAGLVLLKFFLFLG